MAPTEWKHRADGGGWRERAGAFSPRGAVLGQGLLLPRTTAPPRRSSSVAPALGAQPGVTGVLEAHDSPLVSSAPSPSDSTVPHASVIPASPLTAGFSASWLSPRESTPHRDTQVTFVKRNVILLSLP